MDDDIDVGLQESLFPDLEAALFDSGPYKGIRFNNHITKAAILAQAQAHRTYTYRDYTFENLLRYDNLTTHADVNDEQEELHIKAEIERIIDHIQEHDLQESLLSLGDQLGSIASQAALEDIAIVVDKITNNLDLCVFDMATTIIKELAPHRRSSQETNLVVECALSKARSSSRTLIREYVGSDTVVPRPPRQLQIAQDESKLYLTLLEYFTALLGRFLVNSAEGNVWVHKCLGILARMAAKLRLLSDDAATHAERSVRNAQDIMFDLEHDQEVEKQSGGKLEALKYGRRSAMSSSIETFADLVDVTTPTVVYHVEQLRIRIHLTSILKRLLDGFSQRKKVSHWTPFSFELNTIIRATKSVGDNNEEPSWLITDDRHKSIAISDQSTLLRISYPGYQLLLYNLLSIRKRSAQQPQTSPNSGSRDSSDITSATLDWSFTCEAETTGFANDAYEVMSSPEAIFLRQAVQSPEDYISILAPLLLGSSPIARATFRLITTVQSFRGTEKGIKLYQRGRFEAMFTFRCLVGQADSEPPEDDVIALSCFKNIGFQSDPRGEDGDTSGGVTFASKFDYKRFLRPSSSASDVEMANLAPSARPKDFLGIQNAESMYNQYQKRMKSWKITDKTVMVKCNKFVFSAIGLFLAIVIIGLAVLFKFGKKLAGVDRSNILIFLWTIAVFGIGLSKSWYTKEWLWHDFIHRQLPCKSVQELCRVTGVDEQAIMMYLLRNDHKQFYTTGEYNSLFQRRATRRGNNNNSRLSKMDLESVDGFSIDCPLKLSTLLACGFLVFMVGSEDGVHLICIGGKKRIESIQCDSKTRVLVCKAPRVTDQKKEKLELYFEEKNFSWERSYGLYANTNMYFG